MASEKTGENRGKQEGKTGTRGKQGQPELSDFSEKDRGTGQAELRAFIKAYGSATTVAVQGERVLLQGITRTGMTVQMWLNKAERTIETAYPVGK